MKYSNSNKIMYVFCMGQKSKFYGFFTEQILLLIIVGCRANFTLFDEATAVGGTSSGWM